MGKMAQMQNTFFLEINDSAKEGGKMGLSFSLSYKKITMRTRRCSFRSRFHKKNHNANEKVEFCSDIQPLAQDDVLCSF